MDIRIDRFFSSQGLCPRAEVRALLRGGRVTLNGRPVRSPGEKFDPQTDRVELDGQPVRFRRTVYYLMNKPAGVVSASRDPHTRTVLDLLPEELRRPGLFPAGRLDRDTEGLLLITDDGKLAHQLLAPRSHVDKCYEAELDGPPSPQDAAAFAEGLSLSDGLRCLPARLEPSPDGNLCHVRVTLHEGKFHQVKRMFAARGRTVLRLRRVSFGPLRLDPSLPPGGVRPLTNSEIATIFLSKTAD